METIYLTDITGTIGEWLDGEFDDEMPDEVVDLLEQAYALAVGSIEAKSKLDKYNSMLKEKHGANITVEIKNYIEDDNSIWYYYTSDKYGDSDAYETIEEAYKEADIYLCGVGEMW